jgi:hypothetical protein
VSSILSHLMNCILAPFPLIDLMNEGKIQFQDQTIQSTMPTVFQKKTDKSEESSEKLDEAQKQISKQEKKKLKKKNKDSKKDGSTE